MNKKTIFTFCSVSLVCIFIFMACQKSTTPIVNPATTTGASAPTGTLTVDGTSHTSTPSANPIGGSYVIVSSLNYPSISLTFTNTTVPSAGSYTPSPTYPTNGNCKAELTPSTSITWTVVTCSMTVTSGSSRNVSFSNAIFTDGTNTHTVSVNLPF